MNDREFNSLKREILPTLTWWVDHLGLREWEWAWTWHRHPKADSKPGELVWAEINCEADRLQLQISFFLPSIAEYLTRWNGDPDGRARQIERIVVHELTHARVCELMPRGVAEDSERFQEYMFHEERVVAELTNAFQWVANHGKDRPRAVADRKRKEAAKAATAKPE